MRYSRKDLRAMCADGTAWSLMVGIGETYLPAFVLALSASQLACGLVATVPMLAGAVLQLVSPYAVRHLRSHRKWVVGCAVFQAICFLPLIAAAMLGQMSLLWVFAIASLYWAAGLATGPAWNVWVESLVPVRLRARFFAKRAQFGQLGLLAGFVTGGLLLNAGAANENALGAFAALFAMGASGRLVSAYFLARQREPLPPADDSSSLQISRLVSTLRSGPYGRVLVYMLAVQLAVWMAAPYFTPFMLAHLKLSYAGFMVLTCAALVAKVICLPTLGGVCRRWGANRTLWVSGSLIACVPALWILDGGYLYLMLLQIFAGVTWAAFELAMLLVFFEKIPKSQRLGLLTIFNIANAAAIALGAIAGAAVLSLFESTRGGYYVLFALSAMARMAPLLLLARMPRLTLKSWFIATRSIAIRPSMGTVERPVLASMPAAEEESCDQTDTLDPDRPTAEPELEERPEETLAALRVPIAKEEASLASDAPEIIQVI
jgi:MFS family permease